MKEVKTELEIMMDDLAMEIEKGERREIDWGTDVYDKTFPTENGRESCHSTGYEVFRSGEWWNEYVDSVGDLHYGR